MFCSGGTVMSGWLPIFDTLHGIRGEINLIIKVTYVDVFVVILIANGGFFVDFLSTVFFF
jgi:hypothetical protein